MIVDDVELQKTGGVVFGVHNERETVSLFRIHAYEITPQRTKTTKTEPIGGALPRSKVLASSLASLYSSSGLSRQSAVDFKVSAKAARQHDVRDLVIDFTFGAAQKAKLIHGDEYAGQSGSTA